MGNDVVPMPGALDAMINTALTTKWEMVCGSEFDSRFLVANYTEARKFFHGPNNEFTDFSSRPWELHKDFHIGVEPDTRKDIRNLTLFKRSVFEKVGYADVNYWPNGYFEDNQYCLRCDHFGISACGLKEAAFFHFWSRTIHQGENRPNAKYFERNSQYHEEWLRNPVWKIDSRENEYSAINNWRTK
jgi:GT2 family glycosyltransferase